MPATISWLGKKLCFTQKSRIKRMFLKSRSDIVVSRLVYCPDKFSLFIFMRPFFITSRLLINKSSNKILSEFGICTKFPQNLCKKYCVVVSSWLNLISSSALALDRLMIFCKFFPIRLCRPAAIYKAPGCFSYTVPSIILSISIWESSAFRLSIAFIKSCTVSNLA